MLVCLWMTKEVVTVSPSQSIAEAEQLMTVHNLRRIPVTQNNTVVGIICDTDILKAKPSILDPTADSAADEHASLLPVEQIMTVNPVTLQPDAPIEEAALKMRRHKINSVPVVQDGQLIGIITETNIFNAFIEILGAEADGARIELLVDHDNDRFHEMLEVFKRENMGILAITVYPEFSKGHQMVTVKTRGDNLDRLLDELWKKELKVNRVIKDSLASNL